MIQRFWECVCPLAVLDRNVFLHSGGEVFNAV